MDFQRLVGFSAMVAGVFKRSMVFPAIDGTFFDLWDFLRSSNFLRCDCPVLGEREAQVSRGEGSGSFRLPTKPININSGKNARV